MDPKHLMESICALMVVLFYALICLVIPAFFTQIIFKHGQWLAWCIVYLATAMAAGQAIKDYKVDRFINRWMRKKFGVRIFS